MLTNQWQKIFAWNPAKRLQVYVSPFEKFEPLSWRVLIPALLAFTLVVSPVVLESALVLLSILILAGLGALNAKVRALGLGLIGIPALLALFFQTGAMMDKSWAALIAMLEFYALEQLIWGLEEETSQPWRASVLLWFLMPSALGLLGVLLLMLLSNARWQASLSLARVAKKQSLSQHWVLIVLGLMMIASLSALLPLPKIQGITPPSIPMLSFSSGTQNSVPVKPLVPTEVVVVSANALQPKGLGWSNGLSFALILMVVYIVYVQRMLNINALSRVRKPKQSKQTWVWLLLLALTGGVLVFILFGLNDPSKQLQVRVDSSQTSWLALLFFLVLFVLWRLRKPKSGLAETEKPLSSDSDLEKLRYLAPKDAVRAVYFKWLVLLRDLEIRRSPTQTPFEFQSMIRISHPYLQAQTQTLTEAYQRVRYGTTPSQDELEVVLEALKVWQDHVATILPFQVTPQMVSSAL